jgi:putative redox protein
LQSNRHPTSPYFSFPFGIYNRFEGTQMSTVKEKPIWKFNVNGRHNSSTQSVVEARGKSAIIDEPIQRGGTDEGPMPVEYVFMGLAGCTHVISNKLAAANGIEFTSMDIDINVTMDSHGTRLINPIDVPFPSVTLNITAEFEGPREGAVKVSEVLREYCAVSKMLQESGTVVVENWTLNGEPVPQA